jgi:MFS transporter, DHA1 family, multidrug resistance protein
MPSPSAPNPPAPDTGAANWRSALYASWFAQVLSIIAFAGVMPFMPFYVRYLGVQGEGAVALWSGWTIAVAGLTFTVFAPIWGSLSDRYGRKIMVQRAMFGGALVLLAMGLVHNVYQLLVARALQGVLTGTISASTILVCSVTPRERLGYALGLMQTAVLTGNSLGPWLGGIAADHWGYRVPFFISSAFLVLGGITVAVFVHEQFTPLPRTTRQTGALRAAFGLGGLLALLSVFFLVNFSGSFVGPIFPLFVEKIAVGLKAASITGLLIGVTGIAAGVSSILVGHVSDRLGHKHLLVGSIVASGLAAAPQALARSVPQLLVLRVLGGLAGGGTAPLMNAIIGTSAPPEIFGRAYGFAQSASSLGWALGPLAGSAMASHLGLRPPFVVMGALMLGCAVAVSAFVRTGLMPASAPSPEPAE